MYKVMIVGHGYVGSAVASLFSDEEKVIIDPKFNDNKISDYSETKFDSIFVSVDTPKAEGFKLLDSVLSDLNEHVVKGTQFVVNQLLVQNFIMMFVRNIIILKLFIVQNI
tara:strand:- start:478 stop:807 length:330 start_codon:yes stop_codon:yes gene_type:complete